MDYVTLKEFPHIRLNLTVKEIVDQALADTAHDLSFTETPLEERIDEIHLPQEAFNDFLSQAFGGLYNHASVAQRTGVLYRWRCLIRPAAVSGKGAYVRRKNGKIEPL